MSGEGATAALVAAVTAALRRVSGLSGVFDGAPPQAGDAHAVVQAGPETDWGHTSGEGAEGRFALLVRCGREAPGRARLLGEAARAAVAAIGLGPETGWQLVNLTMLRSRVARSGPPGAGPGWTSATEYRARLLRA